MRQKFVGTGVALVTPFDNTGAVDYKSLKLLLDHVITNKVDYLVVNGTTAESATLTDAERNDILAFIINENNNRLPIVYGLGGNNTAEVISKIKALNTTGVDAILSVCPYYNKPSQEGIFLHYQALAQASALPIILYNIPSRTGVNMAPNTIIRLSKVPNIIGVKDATTDITLTLDILKGIPKDFLLLAGDDMWAVPLIALGGQGSISVLANSHPLQFSNMINAALNNEFQKSTTILKSLTTFNHLLYEEGNPVGIKTALQKLNICDNSVRLPLAQASQALVDRIAIAMDEIS